MSGRHACTLVAVALLAPAAAPTAALATPSDVTSTRAYIQADYALSRSAKSHLPTAEASIKGFMRRLGGECRGVAAGSPQNREAEQLNEEIVVELTVRSYRANVAAIALFAHTVGGLRWSNPKLTRVAHSYAARLKALSALALPNVCADVKAWVASGFTMLPAGTKLADKRFETIENQASAVPPKLLAPYEQSDESTILTDTKRIETQLLETESNKGADYLAKIAETLGLNP